MAICLVIMPFREELVSHFDLIKQCGGDLGLDVRRVDTYAYSGNILQAISKALSEADLIVADLSFANPNVMYELAIAHCLGKKVLILTNDRNTVPFDVLSYRVELIDPVAKGQADRLRQVFRLVLDASYIIGPLGGTVVFGQRLFFRRVAAFGADLIPFIGVSLFIGYLASSTAPTTWASFVTLLEASGPFLGASVPAYLLYVAVSTCTLGGTLGQWMLGLKVVTMDGDRVPFWRSVGRAVSLLLVGVTYGVGFLWCLSGPSFRTFHDIASQTMVVRRETATHTHKYSSALARCSLDSDS